VDSLPLDRAKHLVFVLLASRPESGAIRDDILRRYASFSPVILDVARPTSGQSATVLRAKEIIDSGEALLIHNADTAFTADPMWMESARSLGCDGALLVFPSDEARWSYARTDTDGWVREVREKEVISPWASTGSYWFRRGSDFVRLAEARITQGRREAAEHYVAPSTTISSRRAAACGASRWTASVASALLRSIGRPWTAVDGGASNTGCSLSHHRAPETQLLQPAGNLVSESRVVAIPLRPGELPPRGGPTYTGSGSSTIEVPPRTQEIPMRRRRLALVLACGMFVANGCGQGSGSSGLPSQTLEPEGPLGLPSTQGVVVSQSAIGSEVGAEILRRGGNAVDAAIATAFAMVITNPSNANLGGGGFMVVRTPDGRTETIDFREKAPLAASADMYVDPETGGSAWQGSGYRAVGVPGTVAGMYLAHQRHGSLPWEDLVMPAARLAADGVVLPSLAGALNNLTQEGGRMTQFPSSMRAYAKPDGSPWGEEETLRFPDLARSLTAIAQGGEDAFYLGWIADSIAVDMSRNGGLITKEDLARYDAVVRAPIITTYRGYEVAMMGPPSGGGVIIAQALNVLENFDLRSMGQSSPQAVHLVIEAMRRSFLDRARHLGDSDFNPDMPIARLTSKEYGRQLAAEIDLNRASSSAELGADILSMPMTAESNETTHYSVIDGDGMAVSVTYTLEGGYGSAVVASGTGFLLNNEMGDFNRIPGRTDSSGGVGTLPNQIAPEKRMLSSMTPTIVTRDGRVVLITGSPGGRSIPSTVLGVLLGFMEFEGNGREAVDGPRINHQWMPDQASVEINATPAIPQATLDALTAMGHTVRPGGGGQANSIWVDVESGMAYGVADYRNSSASSARP